MKSQISFAQSALNDLEDILEYYSEQKSPEVGKRLVEKVIRDVEILQEQPDSGRVVPEFDLKYLKELIRPPYRIVYLREKQQIRIVRV